MLTPTESHHRHRERTPRDGRPKPSHHARSRGARVAWWSAVALLLLAVVLARPDAAADDAGGANAAGDNGDNENGQPDAEANDLDVDVAGPHERASAAHAAGEYEDALALWTELAEAEPDSAEWRYRGAMTRACIARLASQQDSADEDAVAAALAAALDDVAEAIELGFNDGVRLITEPDFALLRSDARSLERYEEIEAPFMQAREAAAQQAVAAATARWEGYTITAAPRLGVVFATHVAALASDYLVQRLQRVADALRRAYLDQRSAQFITVVLPSREAFRAMVEDPSHGGWYSHYDRTLVAQNLSYTLHHEFTHALQYADFEARVGRRMWGAAHWFVEGFATCFEDSVVVVDATTGAPTMRPVTNARMVYAKDAARSRRRFVPFDELFSQDSETFDGNFGYAEAGTLFRMMHEQGRLASFYRGYAATMADDVTGATALLAAFAEGPDEDDAAELELDDIEDQWKRWVRRQDDAQPRNYQPSGVPSLGVRGDDAPGGLRVTRVTGPAARAGVQRGDVLLSCGGLPVASQAKLNEALNLYRNGNRVELVLLRDGEEIVVLEVRLGR